MRNPKKQIKIRKELQDKKKHEKTKKNILKKLRNKKLLSMRKQNMRNQKIKKSTTFYEEASETKNYENKCLCKGINY